MAEIACLDLNLSGRSGALAAYLVPHAGGAILVDCGPGSTQASLVAGLAAYGYRPNQVTHVLLTHIHLDHAGAAGWLAQQGAQVVVHPIGAPHLVHPERLLASARRIYGDRMEALWGEFLSVPSDQLTVIEDGQILNVGDLSITARHTPGHAKHHVAYVLEDVCFSGDVGGVRKPGPLYVRLPYVPPETDLGEWRASLETIRSTGCRRIAVTHFGIYPDAPGHIDYALRSLAATARWLEQTMPEILGIAELQPRYVAWLHQVGRADGLEESRLSEYDADSPANMGAAGLFRYWRKLHPSEA